MITFLNQVNKLVHINPLIIYLDELVIFFPNCIIYIQILYTIATISMKHTNFSYEWELSTNYILYAFYSTVAELFVDAPFFIFYTLH